MKLNHFIMLINLIRPIAERSGANPAETFARGSIRKGIFCALLLFAGLIPPILYSLSVRQGYFAQYLNHPCPKGRLRPFVPSSLRPFVITVGFAFDLVNSVSKWLVIPVKAGLIYACSGFGRDDQPSSLREDFPLLLDEQIDLSGGDVHPAAYLPAIPTAWEVSRTTRKFSGLSNWNVIIKYV